MDDFDTEAQLFTQLILLSIKLKKPDTLELMKFWQRRLDREFREAYPQRDKQPMRLVGGRR
jgi:hypothetical protein